MNNLVMLIGRIEEIGSDNVMSLKVRDDFKNENGLYEFEIINIKLSDVILKKVKKYADIGQLVSVKGMLKNGYVVGNSVSLLASKRD